MPLVSSLYIPPVAFRCAHWNSIYPAILRNVDYPEKALGGDALLKRVRIATDDGDFLDLDEYPAPAQTLFTAIITHGLAGNSKRRYIRGMARALAREGGAVIAWNRRGCSEEVNRTMRYSNMAEIEDLSAVIRYAEQKGLPIVLAGFSMGAHQTLTYLSRHEQVSPLVRCGITISDPCDLLTCVPCIDAPRNKIFLRYLLGHLLPKVAEKRKIFPDLAKGVDLKSIHNFLEFDNALTAPAFGFKDAYDYWRRASVVRSLPLIRTPVYLLNSIDDPFCDPARHPVKEAEESEFLFFELSRYGGHVGFVAKGEEYYSETRARRFVRRFLFQKML